MLKMFMLTGVATVSLYSVASAAQAIDGVGAASSEQTAAGSIDQRAASDIVVQAKRQEAYAGTKTETPLIEVPQPLTVITSDTYLAQGAINISDTVRYAAGISSDSYGRDTRSDGFTIRGVQALQFRDGMRDIYSYYASITSDPYNFSRVEIVRGPASVLFGQGSIGGIVDLVSKTPVFTNAGEVQLTYGSFDRKEVLADLNLASGDTVAGRIVARVRDAGTQVDHVPDDRVLIAPSVTWRPGAATDITLLGLYQKDNSGSTLNFLPIVGTVRPNRDNPRLSPYLFLGKPGYDRYEGRLLQGAAFLTHRFSDRIKLSLKARYIDSDLSYFTHYTDSYTNPTDPYLDSAGRTIGLYADSSLARLNVFSTDNNIQARFNTGAAIEHTLLAGVDYSWNQVRKAYGGDYQIIDIYNIDYSSISTPQVSGPFSNDAQKQLGLYVQDQVRLWDRVSIVLGARRDHVTGRSLDLSTGSTTRTTDNATTFRAGIIGEVAANISPFFSYTESFQPIAGTTSAGTPFKPSTGNQYEAGFKWQPDRATLLTATAFRIRESNRVLYGPGSLVTQAGLLTTKGVELEATRTLPGQFDLSVAYGYNHVTGDDAASGYLPEHVASLWSTKTFTGELGALRLGAGVRYTGKQISRSDVFSITTPDRVVVDALVELTRDRWRLMLNATNLLNEQGFASCLARGDCFPNAPRNVMLSLGYHF